jgi:hypothetical protein
LFFFEGQNSRAIRLPVTFASVPLGDMLEPLFDNLKVRFE